MIYRITKEFGPLTGDILLPASKSVSNRLLIIRALSGSQFQINNLSQSDDTRVMIQALDTDGEIIDIGHAGTAMRFLTAYLSLKDGTRILTGSERMQNRPISKLVDALHALGADIKYEKQPGFPPLIISGKALEGGTVEIDSNISSQYISALIMIGPVLKKGLNILLRNEVVSSSYIRMTLGLLKEFGVSSTFTSKSIFIPHQVYRGSEYTVESDWSAASYWYAMASLSESAELRIQNLSFNSLQGDSILAGLFEPFGVLTETYKGGVILKKIKKSCNHFNFDFRDNPDLVQTMIVVCGMLGIPFHMTGTETLLIKETDRISAMIREMKKFGISLDSDGEGKWIRWDGNKTEIHSNEVRISTYQDHRMAMAFLPVAIKGWELTVEDPGVVRKSYPDFWDDIIKMGFQIARSG